MAQLKVLVPTSQRQWYYFRNGEDSRRTAGTSEQRYADRGRVGATLRLRLPQSILEARLPPGFGRYKHARLGNGDDG